MDVGRTNVTGQTVNVNSDLMTIFTIMRPIEIRQLSKLIAPSVRVPGRRVPMSEEEFYAIWVNQHERRIRNCCKAFNDYRVEPCREEVLDMGLTMFVMHPEIIEDNNS
jgi:hypothetical protein